MAHAWRWR